MTRAQLQALAVLSEADTGWRCRWVRGGKRSSSLRPVPCVNTKAAFKLVDLGYARLRLLPYASVFSSAYEFRITKEGLDRAAEESADRLASLLL